MRLPTGFTSRIIARTKQVVTGTDYTWHASPDGGATFPADDGGWIYVSNCEWAPGGAGAVRFDRDGNITDAYAILTQSSINCAGGATPWGKWLSCEELEFGRVFECDPFAPGEGVAMPALGTFKHEAVAVEPVNQHLYLTEDEPDGRFYRYVPDAMTSDGFADLSAGVLEVAAVDSDGNVTWLPVPNPNPEPGPDGGDARTRYQVQESTPFAGGEGVVHFDGVIYFSTKGDNRVHAYDVSSQTITVLYDAATAANAVLRGVDNLTMTCCGDVVVAEDGDDMQIVALTPDGTQVPLIQIDGHDGSEITGPAFSPDGQRLYFSSQRGPANGPDGAPLDMIGRFSDGGVTYEVTGPFMS